MEEMCLICSSVCNVNDTRDFYIQDNNNNAIRELENSSFFINIIFVIVL